MNLGFYTFREQIDPRYRRHLKPQFEINNDISHEALFIRLLLGTVSFTNNIEDENFFQDYNYSVLGKRKNPKISTKIFRDCFERENSLETKIKIQCVCDYLEKTKYINIGFFENLLMETTCYFQKKNEGASTVAFLHLYRIIEFISYSFPLIYASISRDYYESFDRLKNYFSGSKNELAFFETFLNNLLGGLGYLDSPFTLNFNHFEPRLNSNHYKVIKGLLTEEKYLNCVTDTSISAEYKHLFFLAINLRNRYFHFSINDKRNIRTTEILETDSFFSIINEEIINWISVIYFQILRAAINKSI